LRLLIVVSALFFAAFVAGASASVCPTGARCGALNVPLDHSGATPGTLPIVYAVLPATGPRVGTVVILTGGPGQTGLPYTDLLKPVTDPLRRSYDVVMVDQRGTGGSGAVDCDEVNETADCADLLGAKRAFLTTAETAKDLDDLRRALNLDTIVPLGVSYGTKVAGEYARRFPEHTAAVVLDSPVNVDGIDFLGLNSIEAMPRVLRETCATGPCASTVKDAAAALYGAVARVHKKGVRGPVYMGREHNKALIGHSRVGEEEVLSVLEASDEDPVLRADLPAALASLARADAAPFLHLLERTRDRIERDNDDPVGGEPDTFMSWSRFIATSCLETKLPWSPASDPATRAATIAPYLKALGPKPFAPFDPQLTWDNGPGELCTDWPATAAPEPVAIAGPDVPVLVLSGRDDIRTPLEDAQRVAAAYPHATVLTVPGTGHSVLTSETGDCALTGLLGFLGKTPVAPCAPTAPTLEASPYRPVSIANARQAAQQTLDSARHDLTAAQRMFGRYARYELGGLRGGFTLVRRGAFDLHAVQLFKSKRVTGTVSARGDGTLKVNGAPYRVRRFRVV
jgi:pimeloyl-ACP methyl ester carboxylesterase